jgi:gamma-glutamylputrescine oxidase
LPAAQQQHVRNYYVASAPAGPTRPALQGAVKADLCIIGGGYTGVSAALHAASRGLSVALLEAENIGWGASGRNGGQMITGQRQDQSKLEQWYGEVVARQLWSLSEEAKALVRSLIADHAIDAQLRPGHLTAAWKPSHARELERYAADMGRRYSYTHGRFVPKAEMENHVATTRYHGGYFDADGAHLHPLRFVQGMALAAERAGAKLFENSRVTRVAKGPVNTAVTAGGEVDAKFLAYAANGYLGDLEPGIAAHILPIDNYLIATEPLGDARAKALIPSGAAIADTKFVLDYYRLSAEGRLIFGGGETYGGAPRYIEDFVRPAMERVFPQLKDVGIDYAWGGTLAITTRRMPHVGRLSPTQYFAHGYSGQGVAIATHMGKLIAQAIAGQAAKFDVYASLKIPALPGGRLLRRPLLTAAMLWYALRDRLG